MIPVERRIRKCLLAWRKDPKTGEKYRPTWIEFSLHRADVQAIVDELDRLRVENERLRQRILTVYAETYCV